MEWNDQFPLWDAVVDVVVDAVKEKKVNTTTMMCYYSCTLHSIASNNNAACVLLAGIASNNNAGSVLLAGIQRCKKIAGL